jgi:hypothetical protein
LAIEAQLKALASFKAAPGLVILAYTGSIDSRLISEIIRLLDASNEDLADFKTANQILRCCAYIAAINRSEELAMAVLARCARLISKDINPDAALRLLLTALQACSAYGDISKYRREVGIVVTRFAYLVPNIVAPEMRKVLEILGCREPRLIGSLGRAMAVLEALVLAA